MKVAAVVLAAGASTRFGKSKQLAVFHGETFVRRIVTAANDAGCMPIVVVVGSDAARITSELAALSVSIAVHQNWSNGLGSSIAVGVRHAADVDPNLDAAILLVCDQPLVTSAALKQLIQMRLENGKPIVASAYADTVGVPALFDRSCFGDLLQLRGDSGAKRIILARRHDVVPLNFPAAAIDIDTAADYEKLRDGRRLRADTVCLIRKESDMATNNANESFTGKVAFVTGAGSGIGRATALAFARAGASVAVADIGEQGNQETARLIEQQGGRALAVRCDVTQTTDVKSALDNTIEAFRRLDFAFNNAGIEQPVMATADLTEREWDRILAVNLRGVFLCMKHEIALMLNQGGGAVVNTSSGAGVKGFKGQAAYAAAKHGVIGLTKSAALDYAAQNIRINAVCPGIISTTMMDRFTGGTAEGRERVISQEPVGRMGKPEEIAAAVLWLCSDAAAFVVGHAMVIDGGQTA